MSVSEFYKVEVKGTKYLATREQIGRGRPTTRVYVLDATREPSKSEVARVRDVLKGSLPSWKRGSRPNNR